MPKTYNLPTLPHVPAQQGNDDCPLAEEDVVAGVDIKTPSGHVIKKGETFIRKGTHFGASYLSAIDAGCKVAEEKKGAQPAENK